MDIVLKALGGGVGLVIFFLSLLITIYWILFPWFVYSKMDKMLKHLGAIERGIMAMPAAPTPVTSTPAPPRPAEYYVANDKDVTGPFTEKQVRELFAKGLVTHESHILLAGTEDWKPIDAVLKL